MSFARVLVWMLIHTMLERKSIWRELQVEILKCLGKLKTAAENLVLLLPHVGECWAIQIMGNNLRCSIFWISLIVIR